MARIEEKLVCELCNREVSFVTRHHLLPKEEGGRYSDTVNLCQPCHSTVHLKFSNLELAKDFNTITALQNAERLQKYLTWIKTKNIDKIRNRRGKHR